MLTVLDADAVRRWCTAARQDLASARERLDALNVFPVPDGDTGSNLLMTLQAAEAAVLEAAQREQAGEDGRSGDCSMAGMATALASGALLGARGSSGVIVAQLLRGVAEELAAAPSCDGGGLQRALTHASTLARQAVATPVEGTVLTVARDSAEAAAAATGDLSCVLAAAVEAAARSLERTPSLLPALARAGVVDAGGLGWCVVLAALHRVVTGVESAPFGDALCVPPMLVPRERSGLAQAREQGSDLYAYEVQFLLRLSGTSAEQAAAVTRLRATLLELGDALVVVGGEGLFNVHVHVNDVGAAFEAGVEAGRPFRITVTRFEDQYLASTERRVVLVALTDPATAPLFRNAGAGVVAGGQEGEPSPEQLVQALLGTGAVELVVLPGDLEAAQAAATAAETARGVGLSVVVLPTRSALQALSALAVADPERPFADDVVAMTEAAGSTRHGEVRIACEQAATSAGICQPGDVLGLLDGDVVVLGRELETVAQELLRRLLAGGGELVTLIVGAQVAEGVDQRLRCWVEQQAPSAEVVEYRTESGVVLLGVE